MVLTLKIKYPKFLTLIITIIFAFLILSHEFIISPIVNLLLSLGTFGIFLTGVFFAYSFTAAPATAVLLIIAKSNINFIFIAVIAGFGALIGDLLIFKFIRHSFINELELFSKEKIVLYINGKTHPIIKKYVMIIIGFIVIASPFPDEIGIFLLAEFTFISTRLFSLLSLILNTCGILVILIIGNVI